MSMDCVKEIELEQIKYIVLSPFMIFKDFHRNLLQLKANFKPHKVVKNFTIRKHLIESKKMYYLYDCTTHADFYFDQKMIDELDDVDFHKDFDF